MAWVSDNVTSSFNANEKIQTQINNRGERSSTTVEPLEGVSLVGMNCEPTVVEPVINAINEYVTGIITVVDGLQENADPSNAYKGTNVKVAVSNYLTKVQTYCNNLCSQLLAFADKLVDARNKWIEGMGNIADTINTATDAYSEGTAYTTTEVFSGAEGDDGYYSAQSNGS